MWGLISGMRVVFWAPSTYAPYRMCTCTHKFTSIHTQTCTLITCALLIAHTNTRTMLMSVSASMSPVEHDHLSPCLHGHTQVVKQGGRFQGPKWNCVTTTWNSWSRLPIMPMNMPRLEAWKVILCWAWPLLCHSHKHTEQIEGIFPLACRIDVYVRTWDFLIY